MSRDLVPRSGARLLLERQRDDGSCAFYRAAIFTPATTYEGHATLNEDGTAALDIAGAPDELALAITTLARVTARSAAKRRADGLSPWPPRVLRWRG